MHQSGKQPFSTQIVGGVKFEYISDPMDNYDFNEVEIFNNRHPNKRNSANRSPLEVKRDAKLVKV